MKHIVLSNRQNQIENENIPQAVLILIEEVDIDDEEEEALQALIIDDEDLEANHTN